MSYKKPISRSRYILGGIPVFSGTRVPIRALLDYLESGKTTGEFLRDFPSVKRVQAIQVLRLVKKSLLKKRYASAA